MRGLARTIALTGANQVARPAASVYLGFTIRETAGAAAVVRIWDNAAAAAGTVLEEISLAANESRGECYASGVWAENGIYVQVVSGTVAGTLRIG